MNLVPLFEEALEFQDYNGTVLSDGKVAVYYIGRTRLADIYEDVAAEYPAENPRILNNLGMGPVYVNPAFDYEMVVFDAYGSELFSVKKYLASKGEHSTANVVVTPSESIAVSAWTVGDVQVYMPYLTGQLGKVYEGIDPIVVNNQVDKISANHVPLGVQDPLYFVQDDEEGCIIGCSAQTEIPSALSSKWDEASDAVIANSAQWSEGATYEAGSYVDIDGNTINVTGLQPAGNYQSAGDYVVHDELSSYATQNWVNEQGFLTAVPSEYVTENTLQSGLSSKLDSTAFSTVSGDFLTAHQSLDGLMSADLLEISDNKITGYNGTAFAGQGGVTGDFTLVEGNGIQLTDDPIAQTTTISVSGDYATQEDIESATSGLFPSSAVSPLVNSLMSSITSTTVSYSTKPSAEAIYATDNNLYNVNYIAGTGININSSYLWLKGIVTATTGGLSASGLSVNNNSSWGGFTANGLTANYGGISASGLTAGAGASFVIKCAPEAFSGGELTGFTFSSQNTSFGTAKLTTANGNSIVQMYSPKFEAKNISGAGFSIEGSGAKGYDHNGNVVWDTTKPAKLIGWSNYQGTAIDPRATGINGGIIATVYPDQIPANMAISSAPYSYMNGYGLFACYPDGTELSVNTNNHSISVVAQAMSATAAMNSGDVSYRKYNTATSATDTWSLTGSVQKREIEGDTATSAITAIAGSAIGGGGGVSQSAFDELKQSYDALSALFAQYSGQWLLPNEGEE